jgi:hypothetical protein
MSGFGFGEWLGRGISSVGLGIEQLPSPIAKAIGRTLEQVGNAIEGESGAGEAAVNSGSAGEAIAKTLGSIGGGAAAIGITELVVTGSVTLAVGAGAVLTAAPVLGVIALGAIAGGGAWLGSKLSGWAYNAIAESPLGDTISSAWHTITGAASSAWQTVTGAASSAWDTITGAAALASRSPRPRRRRANGHESSVSVIPTR